MNIISDDKIGKAIGELQTKPFAHSVEPMDNTDLADALTELLLLRSLMLEIKELAT